LVNRAQEESSNYRNIYKSAIPGRYLAERIAGYVQAHTLYSSVRPFGASAILGVVDKTGPQIYMIEPSGIYWVNNIVDEWMDEWK
jgi:20S proteasome subunit alpha 7